MVLFSMVMLCNPLAVFLPLSLLMALLPGVFVVFNLLTILVPLARLRLADNTVNSEETYDFCRHSYDHFAFA